MPYRLAKNEALQPYPIYGVTVAEVEVDLLTGQHIIQRVDIIEDAGISLNPEIDLGQVEGSFIMGVGYWTSEDLIYDPRTGVLTNNRTWVYRTGPKNKGGKKFSRICAMFTPNFSRACFHQNLFPLNLKLPNPRI